MGWQFLGLISLLWLVPTVIAITNLDYNNILVYFGIFLTNTGLMLHAVHQT